MEEKPITAKTEAPPAATKRKDAADRGGGAVSGFALILSVIAVIVSGYVWYGVLYEKRDLLEADVLGALKRQDQRAQALADTQGASAGEIKQLRDTQETLKSAVAQMRDDLGRSRTDWALAETEQLLLIANRRLQLARDVASAMAALRAADRQLEVLADPKLLPVRRELARELTALGALERADIPGMSLRLGSLAESIEHLPLAAHTHLVAANTPVAVATAADEKPAGGWMGLREIWRDLASLVRFRDDVANHRPLLPPEQTYFVRENLRLVLYGAQHALLQGNYGTYRQNLEAALAWLAQYFDPQAQAVIAARAELERLHATQELSSLPDMSGSLAALRRITGKGSGT